MGTASAADALPMSIVYAVRGRAAKVWVIPLLIGLVVGGAVLGIYLLDAKADSF